MESIYRSRSPLSTDFFDIRTVDLGSDARGAPHWRDAPLDYPLSNREPGTYEPLRNNLHILESGVWVELPNKGQNGLEIFVIDDTEQISFFTLQSEPNKPDGQMGPFHHLDVAGASPENSPEAFQPNRSIPLK